MKRRFLNLVIVLAMLVSFVAIPTTAGATSLLYYFSSSDEHIGTLDEDGTLILHGIETGELFEDKGAPWFEDRDSIINVVILDGVKIIDMDSFYDCPNIISVTIPVSVEIIESGAFSYSDNLTDIYYSGSEEDWNKIQIGDHNDSWENVTIHYNSTSVRVAQTEVSETSDNTDEIKVFVDDGILYFDQSPIIISGRTMVPIRMIFEALGYSVDWDSSTETATAIRGSNSITVQIGNSKVNYVTDGKVGTYVCEVAPQIISDRTLVPVRAIAECAGCIVDWDGDSKTVIILSEEIM